MTSRDASNDPFTSPNLFVDFKKEWGLGVLSELQSFDSLVLISTTLYKKALSMLKSGILVVNKSVLYYLAMSSPKRRRIMGWCARNACALSIQREVLACDISFQGIKKFGPA